MPKTNLEFYKAQVETQKLELEIIKDSLEISMRKGNKIQFKHNSEIESITRQLEGNKSLGNRKQVSTWVTLLMNKEQQFQDLISTTSEMCRRLSARVGIRNGQIPMEQMQSIKQVRFEYQKELERLK